jgi:hypothetical protein
VTFPEIDPGRVLILRVWFEPGDGSGFRARIISTVDIESRQQEVVETSPEDALEVVRGWLAQILGEPPRR